VAFDLLLISEREDDLAFCGKLSKSVNFPFHHVHSRDQLKSFLIDHPECIIFWDCDHEEASKDNSPKSVAAIGKILKDFGNPLKIFAITDKPLNQYPYLFKVPVFGHHIFRRYQEPALQLYSTIVQSMFVNHPFGLNRFFPEGTPNQKVVLTASRQKSPAVQAVQNVLGKIGVTNRLTGIVAQAVDELIMNAIFDAPHEDGAPTRKTLPRTEAFLFPPGEEVWLEMMMTDKYVGICVADGYGTLKKDVILGFLRKNYQEESYKDKKGGGGLGLNEIIHSGLSVLFICKPDSRTEVMLFFPRAGNYKEFREGIRFVSLITA